MIPLLILTYLENNETKVSFVFKSCMYLSLFLTKIMFFKAFIYNLFNDWKLDENKTFFSFLPKKILGNRIHIFTTFLCIIFFYFTILALKT